MELRRSFIARYGARRGTKLWREWAAYDDADAPTTVRRRRFPYQTPPRRPARGGLAIADAGSLRRTSVVAGGGAAPPGLLDGLLSGLLPPAGASAAMSNALVVSAAESASGKPLAVFGPQVSYFSPQILVEQDVHAPTIDARGAAFPGVNLYVQLGRGQDYSWSATSAGQDIIDTFALELCEPDGRAPAIDSSHYRFRGACLPIEVLEQTNRWTSTLADPTPAGHQTLRALRTKLGLVTARATIAGKPVIYTRLRSTYLHEIDSARGFSDFNDPAKMRDARDFQRAAAKIGYTFNWLYADDRDIAYFNSGDNPQRASGVTGQLPMPPASSGAASTRSARPPRTRRSPSIRGRSTASRTSPRGTTSRRAATPAPTRTSSRRSSARRCSTRRSSRGSRASARSRSQGSSRRWARRRRPTCARSRCCRWRCRSSAHRATPSSPRPCATCATGSPRARIAATATATGATSTPTRSGSSTPSGRAGCAPSSQPSLGDKLFDQLRDAHELDNTPNGRGAHQGSAYQGGWYGYAAKDLRRVLGRKVAQPYSKRYCGGGSRARCRSALRGALARALDDTPADLYADDACTAAGKRNDQVCFDAIAFRSTGGLTQPMIGWQNRPTYQQAVEVRGHRPRPG